LSDELDTFSVCAHPILSGSARIPVIVTMFCRGVCVVTLAVVKGLDDVFLVVIETLEVVTLVVPPDVEFFLVE
jgi:hypothetical protein